MNRLRPLLVLCVLSTSSLAAERVDYLREIKPLLSRCYGCHGALRQQAGLRVDTATLLAKGGDSGSAVFPGKSAESLLIDAITGADGASLMPPEGEGERLTDAEIALIRRWIDQGAAAPDEPVPQDPRQHWAFQRPVKPQVPTVANTNWVHTPIDAFIAAEHEQSGLTPLPEAEKNVLLRRVYLDLIGLPPTREQLQAFLRDDSANAYENVVRTLLDSPRHGERWGRHWMDVWRYSDWAGYRQEIRESQYHIWRWRDWIIESLNEDKPYDRMIVEMLAGDEVAPTDQRVLRATGYLGRSWYKFNRNVWLENTVEHCGKAFLGLTFNCAKCHDHKYDPIDHADFYRMRAFFEPHQVRYDQVDGETDVIKTGLSRVYDKDLQAPTYRFERGNDKHPDKDNPLSAQLPELFGAELPIEPIELPVIAYYPALHPDQIAATRQRHEQQIKEAAKQLSTANDAVAKAARQRDRLASDEPEKPKRPKRAARVVINDDFAQRRDDVWEYRDGEWEFADGRVLQKRISTARSSAVSLQPHPRDFHAKFRFKTVGGNVYKSVGLSFDITESGESQTVYLSAHANGKVQASHRVNGSDVYPVEGKVDHPVKLNTEYTLEVAVRDTLMNIWVNDRLELVYRLPIPRRDGRFSVWAFDARAEFHEVAVSTLNEQLQLAEKKSGAAVMTLADATKAHEIAKLRQQVATRKAETEQARAKSYEARLAAERRKYELTDAGDPTELARHASLAERGADLLNAEHAVAAAQLAVAEAKAEDKPTDEATKQLTAANKQLAAAKEKRDADTSAYKPVGEVYPKTSTGRRLALARWIANRDNPLTARVAVNHIWLRHFGSPLVPSVFDFGNNGRPPTHPQLLDWLAIELMDNGWRMKRIHELIVTSNTYRMRSSAGTGGHANESVDPDNRLLWRANVRRLEAEAVRDSVLQIGGSLDATMGGPEIDQAQGQTVPRRSIYFRHAKEKRMTFVKLFDGPGVLECYQRDESIVPQQALALSNSPLAKSQSRKLAKQLSSECGEEQSGGVIDAFVSAAFEQLLSRSPNGDELTACRDFLASQTQLLAKEGLTAATAGSKGTVAPQGDAHLRARENLIHVLINHNDFVTVR